MADDQLALFWPIADPKAAAAHPAAAVEPPSWLTGGESTEQRRQALLGKHPTGRPLLGGPESCRTYTHCLRFQRAKAWHKCALDHHRWTHGRGSDIRLRWPACSQWRD